MVGFVWTKKPPNNLYKQKGNEQEGRFKKNAMKISRESDDIYKMFKFDLVKGQGSKPAKPSTIQVMKNLCKMCPKNILELGGGTGTITYTLLSNSNAHIDVYEQTDFCRDQLNENLKEFKGRYTIHPSYMTLPPRRDYDIMVVDGAEAKDHEYGYGAVAELFLRYLRDVKTVYIEGRRGKQRRQVRRALRSKGIYWIHRHSDKLYNGEFLAGGQEIHFWKTNNKFLRFLNYWFWETLMWFNAARIKPFYRKDIKQ